MITYLYWILIIALSGALGWLVNRVFNVKAGLIVGLIALFIGWLLYVFHYEQYFVKNLGGVMSITVPAGQMHIHATWKDDHLWIQNYDPAKNECYFTEYAKGNMLEGKVVIKNCNPLKTSAPIQTP